MYCKGISGGAAGYGFFCNGTAGTKYQGALSSSAMQNLRFESLILSNFVSKGGNGCKGNPTSATAGGGGGYYGGGGGCVALFCGHFSQNVNIF